MRNPSTIVLTALLVALLGAGCGQAAPTPSGGRSSAPSSMPSAGPVIDAAACALVGQPQPPNPAPQAGGEGVDLADFGNGRVRLCFDGAEPIEIEADGSCLWNDGRTTVTTVAGLPVAAGKDRRVAGGLDLTRSEVFVELYGPAPNDLSIYRNGGEPQIIEPGPNGTSGAARFLLKRVIQPEDPPAAPPAESVGTLRWACGEPPAMRPGLATGRVTLQLDAPIARRWEVAARCGWVITPLGARLSSIQTDPADMSYEGRLLAVQASIDGREPDGVSVTLYVTSGDKFANYVAREENVIRLGLAADGGSAALRLRHMPLDELTDLHITGNVVDTSGVVRWTCPPPAVSGPEAEWVDTDPPETHPGAARLTFDPAVVDPVEGAITCTFDRTDPDYILIRQIRGSLRAENGGRYEVRSTGSVVVLAMVTADGNPAGEYTGDIARIGDEAGRGPLLIDVPALKFEPTDPAYVPLGGRDAPRQLRLLIDYTCELGDG